MTHSASFAALCSPASGERGAPGQLAGPRLRRYDQPSLENLRLPSSMQSLTLGVMSHVNLGNVMLLSSLLNLIVGVMFNQELEHVALPSDTQSLILGAMFN